jgi:acyl carrier protein
MNLDKIIIRRIYIMDLNKVKEVVAEQLGVEITDLKPETSLKDDLSADSLDLFQIIMSLEEEFSIEIPTEDTESINTIGDIEAYLEKRKAE